MAIADKLQNIINVKKDLADKFYIGSNVPLAGYPERISNTDGIVLGIIDDNKYFQPLKVGQDCSVIDSSPVAVETFYTFAMETSEITDPISSESTDYENKLLNILTVKNQIADKFALDSTLKFADYAGTISVGDTAILGYVDADRNFQDLVFENKNCYIKNSPQSDVKFYTYSSKLETKPLTLTALEDSVLYFEDPACRTSVYYRRNGSGDWTAMRQLKKFEMLSGEYIEFWNKSYILNDGDNLPARFYSSQGAFEVSGTITSMLNYNDNCTWGCYDSLFLDFTSLVSAENLIFAKNPSEYCYLYLFRGATGLAKIPKNLYPDNTAVSNAFFGAFYGCSSIPEVVLPNIEKCGSVNMFHGCTGIKSVIMKVEGDPGNCSYMFDGCSNLQTAEICCKTVPRSNNIFQYIFNGCSNLNSIKVYFTTWQDAIPTYHWMDGVASAGTFYKSAELPDIFGISYIPKNWDVVDFE